MKTIKSVGCLIIVWGGTLAAADTLWTGAAGNNLLAGSNWTLGVPTNSQPGLIGAGGRAEILNNPANSAEQHTLSNKVLTLQGDATLTSRTTDAVKLSGGTLNLKGQSAFIHTLSAAGLFLGTWGPGVITLEPTPNWTWGVGGSTWTAWVPPCNWLEPPDSFVENFVEGAASSRCLAGN
ncbi:hypothetical protein [Verrucomicrobium spinosum]|uniref:hypothetical protein n=1 Tax=Verrucomicrobium spinosum TaxID=2736 RepID=UPI00210D469A|nr:hypothetical protein [Verrucomicrobium spinosum]